MTVGERIKMHRVLKGLSLRELAKKSGMCHSVMHKYERDQIVNLRVKSVELIAKGLDVSPSYLLGWQDDYTNTGMLINLVEGVISMVKNGELENLNLINTVLDHLAKPEQITIQQIKSLLEETNLGDRKVPVKINDF